MEIEAMHDLYKQGQINKVELHMISATEARKIDGLSVGMEMNSFGRQLHVLQMLRVSVNY